MINLKPEIRKALKTLQVPVYAEFPDVMESLPAITFYEANNHDSAFADDEAYEATIEFYVHVWGNSIEEIEPLAQQVDRKMKELDFIRNFGADDYSADSKRKILRYMTIREV